MPGEKRFLRITRFVGKVILGLLLVVVAMVAFIHLPAAQKEITRRLSTYLSSEIKAKITIQNLSFSIFGNVVIEDITIWDPTNNEILSIDKITAGFNTFRLVTGNFVFDELHLAGTDGKLIETEEGLNIQFILDALSPSEERTTTKSNAVNLKSNSVLLEDIKLDFTSTVNRTYLALNLGRVAGRDVEFSTHPNKIRADQITIEHSVVNTLLTTDAESNSASQNAKHKTSFSPDFDTGIIFEIRDLELKNNEISLHSDQVIHTQKFSPDHIVVSEIHVSLSNILIREDTLTAGLKSMSFQLPGFALTEGIAQLELNRSEVNLSGLHLSTVFSELYADFTGPYTLAQEDTAHANGQITLRSRINPQDLSYFFSDSVMGAFNPWGPTDLALEGDYSMGKGKIKTLSLKTGNSVLRGSGMVADFLDADKISWKGIIIDASIGSDFQKFLAPFVGGIGVTDIATLQLKSSGNLKKITADAKIFTKWGNATATGLISPNKNDTGIDLTLTGENVELGKWLNLPWVGLTDLMASAKGTIGNNQHLDIEGVIDNIQLFTQQIHQIAFRGQTEQTTASVTVSIGDPNYQSEITSEISFVEPLVFANDIHLNHFKLGSLLHMDSTFSISGDTRSRITLEHSSINGFVEGDSILLENQRMQFLLDTLAFQGVISPTISDIRYHTENADVALTTNFDLRDAPDVIRHWSQNMFNAVDKGLPSTGARSANFTLALGNANFTKLLGLEIEEFSSLRLTGALDERNKSTSLQATSGKFKGYGISLDTLNANLKALQDTVSVALDVDDIFYDSVKLGNLEFNLLGNGDTATSNVLLTSDSLTLLGLRARILQSDSGSLIYPETLRAFNRDYFIDLQNPVYLTKDNLVFDHVQIRRENMQINLDGDRSYLDASFRNIDLMPLNFLISDDTTVINKGHLSGEVSWSRDQRLKFKAAIDSLILYNSTPLRVNATAESAGNQLPFEFILSNEGNQIDLSGLYYRDINEVDASLLLNVNNPGLFRFLVSDVIAEMKGTVKGKTTIRGPLQKPAFKGSLRFVDAGVITVNPKLTFNVDDDSVQLDNSSLLFNSFTLYDERHHPLTIDGYITLTDNKSYTYDLKIDSDEYTLINQPDSVAGKLRGLLVIDSDVRLTGNAKDTNVKANIIVTDATDLTIATSNDDIELLKAEGIIDFIDPAALTDSAVQERSINFYDSLIASLPDFNLSSTLAIDDNAVLRVILDEQSGDFIEASGAANLEFAYDRTGNLHLSGNYTVARGVYRLSFYDLVKKSFTVAPGSSVNWSGSPENGDLNIKAIHTVESNSIGLIGHEIGENEKSAYKRSLDYEVGININGTIDSPVVSFSLDLPQNDKASYPVLANKLDRLRQPEYESELNKQVFGLLVLGGFLPESSGSDINSNLIATTALSNSVNSLLASQLNRFASQYVKGVNIDVGIQSYSDYSAPGGKTQTAMDFRVSKSVLNDRLSFEIGGDFDINQDQSGGNTGKNYRGDIAIIYDLTGNGDKQLKLFNNETYDIVYQEIRNTGISLIFIREFARKEKNKNQDK